MRCHDPAAGTNPDWLADAASSINWGVGPREIERRHQTTADDDSRASNQEVSLP
jgi:hypothetical protein